MILKVRKEFMVFEQCDLLWSDLLQLTYYILEAMVTTTDQNQPQHNINKNSGIEIPEAWMPTISQHSTTAEYVKGFQLSNWLYSL